jgi:hypothetical protein
MTYEKERKKKFQNNFNECVDCVDDLFLFLHLWMRLNEWCCDCLYLVLKSGRENNRMNWESVFSCLSFKSMLVFVLCAFLNEKRMYSIHEIKRSVCVDEYLCRMGVPLFGAARISSNEYNYYYYIFNHVRYNCLTVDHCWRLRGWLAGIKIEDLIIEKNGWRREEKEGVYCWMGVRTRKYYIGRTKNIKMRIQQHITCALKEMERKEKRIMEGKLKVEVEEKKEKKKINNESYVYKRIVECGVEEFFIFLS